MKAIPTKYNGYKFESRLEARWAVFFDVSGLAYYYEYEGYVLNNGVWYLPDFYLPQLKCHIEIKPNELIPFKPPDKWQFAKDFKSDYESKWKPFSDEANIIIKFGLPDGLPSFLNYHIDLGQGMEIYPTDVLFHEDKKFFIDADGLDNSELEPYKSAIEAAKQARF